MQNSASRAPSGRERLAELRGQLPMILPSLLQCDLARLADVASRLEAAGTRVLHLDVMDGHFVPNLTYGMPVVAHLRRATKLVLDAHLMISQPQRYLEPFREAGADSITIHAEAVADPRPILEEIRALGAAAGLAINPPTPVESIAHCLDVCDLVLVMSVMPGFGGQSFDERALAKLRQVRQLAGDDVLLEVDGGVNEQTIARCAEAGAQLMVVGSAIFKHDDYCHPIETLTRLARQGTGR